MARSIVIGKTREAQSNPRLFVYYWYYLLRKPIGSFGESKAGPDACAV